MMPEYRLFLLRIIVRRRGRHLILRVLLHGKPLFGINYHREALRREEVRWFLAKVGRRPSERRVLHVHLGEGGKLHILEVINGKIRWVLWRELKRLFRALRRGRRGRR